MSKCSWAGIKDGTLPSLAACESSEFVKENTDRKNESKQKSGH